MSRRPRPEGVKVKQLLEDFGIMVFLCAATLVLVIASVDAYEFEQTGKCTGCLVLPHLNDRFKPGE